MNDFELLHEFVSNGIKISKYMSKKTGLSVVLADVEGPIVEGAFVLATEAHDDDGCPHTLEHLIFLGSELYPYKGILDGLANRCLAQGTNAWTDTDHTAYTLSTAGAEGFLNLLPVYMDHVLYPVLTDTGFHTEVHHINGEGEDAGVVYCEMQGRENSSISLVHRGLLQSVYPGDCGYRSETGGIMANLRSLHVDKVRQYHKDFYRPDNLCMIITGKVDPKEVFKALQPVEERIGKKGALKPMTRPWSTPVDPLNESVTRIVPFPSDDEATGTVMLGWRGPTYKEFEEITALKTLWKYLTDSSVSPLYKVFVEIEEPLCTDISPGTIENSVLCQYAKFDSVPTEKISTIKDTFFKTINEIFDKGVDLKRMADIIHKSILEEYNKIEENPHRSIQFGVIGHFLYGTEPKQLEENFAEVNRLESLKAKDISYWKEIIKKYILDKAVVCIDGTPSAKLGSETAAKETERTQKQREQLGDKKLEDLKNQLADATKKNDVPFPDELITQFPVPDVTKIPFIPVKTIRNDEVITNTEDTIQLRERLNQETSKQVPFFMEFDHVTSAFVQIRALVDTSSVPDNLRPYLEFYNDIFFELPILRNDQVIPYEDVVAALNRDTLSYKISSGIGGNTFECGSFSQNLIVELKLERSKYKLGVQWLKELVWQTQFTPEKLKINIAKLLNDIPQRKRRGPVITRAAIYGLNFDENKSNHAVSSILKQQKFLQVIAKKLENPEEGAALCKDLTQFRNVLVDPKNIRIQVVGNLKEMTEAKTPWVSEFLPSSAANNSYLDHVTFTYAQQLLSNTSSGNNGLIAGLAAIESSFLSQTGKGPSSFQDADEAPMLVLMEYLTGMESPFWKKIRGLGLSYGYGIHMRIEEGLTYFSLVKSSNLVKAYEVSKEIIGDILSRKVDLENVRVESAKSGVIFSIVSREETMESAALQALLGYLRKTGPNGNKELLSKVQQVKRDDIYRVLEKYLKPLFDPQQSNVAIATNPSKIEEISKGFAFLDRKLQELTNI